MCISIVLMKRFIEFIRQLCNKNPAEFPPGFFVYVCRYVRVQICTCVHVFGIIIICSF